MNRPRITLKVAQSLDGRLATASGDSKWITGEAARTVAHQLRAEHDAVLVGIGTVLTDDPLLTVRLVPGRNPIRVVLDSTLHIPLNARLLQEDGTTLVFASDRAPADALTRTLSGAELVLVPPGNGGLDLDAVLAELTARGLRSLMVEGGARVITSFLKARLVDDLAVFIAPKFLGAGRAAVESLDIDRIDQAIVAENVRYEQVGTDLLVRASLTS